MGNYHLVEIKKERIRLSDTIIYRGSLLFRCDVEDITGTPKVIIGDKICREMERFIYKDFESKLYELEAFCKRTIISRGSLHELNGRLKDLKYSIPKLQGYFCE